MDPAACAAAALCSRWSTLRAQLLVAEALHAGQQRRVRDITGNLRDDPQRSRVVSLKRLWDETALRVQMSPASMKGLLGHDFAVHAMETKGKRIVLLVLSFRAFNKWHFVGGALAL